MDSIPSEMLRGHMDTIILLSLIDCDKHTNQIREEIEERAEGQFVLKQGTYYSCLQRIVKQGYVTEYRSTSLDGVRRKFYQLTEKGKAYIDDNKDKWAFSRRVIDTLIQTPEEEEIAVVAVAAPASVREEKIVEPTKKEKPSTTISQEAVLTDNDEAEKEVSPERKLEEFLSKQFEDDELLQKEEAVHKETIRKDEVYQETIESILSSADGTPQNMFREGKTDRVINFNDVKSKIAVKEEQTTFERIEAESAFVKSDKNLETSSKNAPTQKLEQITIDSIREEASKLDKKAEADEVPLIVNNNIPPIPNDLSKNDNFAKGENFSDLAIESRPSKPTISNESNIKQEQIASESAKLQPIIEQPQSQPRQVVQPIIEEPPIDDDFYSGEGSFAREYKFVLNKLFPQTSDKKPLKDIREIDYVEGTDIDSYFDHDKTSDNRKLKEPLQQEPRQQGKQKSRNELKFDDNGVYPLKDDIKSDAYDFSEIRALAEQEGFKVKTSSASKRRDVGKILVNKLSAHASLTFYFIALCEIVLLGLTTSSIVGTDFIPFIITAAVLAIFPLICWIIYAIDPKHRVTQIASFKSVLELVVIIMLNLTLIIIAYCILLNIDFSNSSQLMLYVFYPLIAILNIPLYYFIKYLKLEKSHYFY